MMMAQTHEPLTSERLAEIRKSVDDMNNWGPLANSTTVIEFADMCEELLAALAAAEAREAQWREIGEVVANAGAEVNYGHDTSFLLLCPGDDAGHIRDKARALLAATTAVEAEP